MEASVQKRLKVVGTSCLLFLIALFLTAYSAKNPSVARVGSALVLRVLYPFQAVNRLVFSSISNYAESYLVLVDTQRENKHLYKRIQKLEAENTALQELANENKNLRALLKFTEESNLEGVVANVIGHGATKWIRSVTVDRGLKDGVRQGMAVIQGDAVVGQVRSVALTSSSVLLITDLTSGVDAIVRKTRARGVVAGAGNRLCDLRYILGDEQLAEGDIVITSGLDGVYPKGLVVGQVANVEKRLNSLFLEADLKPKVNFSKVEMVFIIKDK